jgi:hypothetical protein
LPAGNLQRRGASDTLTSAALLADSGRQAAHVRQVFQQKGSLFGFD